MRIPTIHLNGTPAEHLASYLRNAGEALHAALDALQATAPNARDYYVQGEGAYSQADNEHVERLRAIKRVREEIGEIHEAVVSQIDEREARRA